MSAKNVKSPKGKKGKDPENVVKYSIYGIGGVVGVCILLIIVFLIIPNTVATAGDEKITQDEYTFFYTQAVNSYMQYNTEQIDMETFLNQDIGGVTYKQMAISSSVQQVHEYKIQYDLAKKNKLTLTQEESNNVAENLKQYLEQTASQYDVSIDTIAKANFGMSYSKALKIYKKMMLGDKYKSQTIENMNFSKEDYEKYYEENKESIDRVKARHILLKIDEENDSKVKIEGLEKKANDILEQINSGEDFAELVKEYSDDTGTVEKGGEVTFSRGRMVPEFEEFVFNNDPGTKGVVKSQYGYHIIEVLDHYFGYKENMDVVQTQLPIEKYKEKMDKLKENEYAFKFRPSFNKLFKTDRPATTSASR